MSLGFGLHLSQEISIAAEIQPELAAAEVPALWSEQTCSERPANDSPSTTALLHESPEQTAPLEALSAHTTFRKSKIRHAP